MARQPRKVSGTGIYHVMMRGINRQDIFEDDGDYRFFIKLLQQIANPKDESGFRNQRFQRSTLIA